MHGPVLPAATEAPAATEPELPWGSGAWNAREFRAHGLTPPAEALADEVRIQAAEAARMASRGPAAAPVRGPSFTTFRESAAVRRSAPVPPGGPVPARPGAPAPRGPPAPGHVCPGAYLSLGYLKLFNDPAFSYFEWNYLKQVERLLGDLWHLIQGGYDANCADLWYQICRLLELDEKVIRELWILLHGGAVGRALANEVMWGLLTREALEANYLNLSNCLSVKLKDARRRMDRPPARHEDRGYWGWDKYTAPDRPQWAASSVPQVPGWFYTRSMHNHPLPPPGCWGLPADPHEVPARRQRYARSSSQPAGGA
jgi:hypothetical protein